MVAEIAKVTDLPQRSPNESSGRTSHIKGIMTKLEGSTMVVMPHSPDKGSRSPALLRARASMSVEEGPSSRASIEAEDEPNVANTRSVFGLDTSAIDATAMCGSDESQPQSMSKELTDLLTPSSVIVSFVLTIYLNVL